MNEVGLPGLVFWVALTMLLIWLGATANARLEDLEIRVDLAAICAVIIGLTIMGFAGAFSESQAAGPFFWFAPGVCAYWLAGPGPGEPCAQAASEQASLLAAERRSLMRAVPIAPGLAQRALLARRERLSLLIGEARSTVGWLALCSAPVRLRRSGVPALIVADRCLALVDGQEDGAARPTSASSICTRSVHHLLLIALGAGARRG